VLDTPLGPLTLVATAEAAFGAYFAGEAAEVSLPTSAAGTPFQRQVWAELATIPPGTTRTYLEVATALGKPAAVRAVAAAIGANPLSIAVPCHRVIGTNGAITGYAGGVARKQWLLDHERP
jgi:methylated-DNA-[protein]-cysteine S-methyltransferase